MDNDVNFKIETERAINGRKVKQYRLIALNRGLKDDKVFEGEGEIDWKKIPKKLLDYDAGYGSEWWLQLTPPKFELPSKEMSKETIEEIVNKKDKKEKKFDDISI